MENKVDIRERNRVKRGRELVFQTFSLYSPSLSISDFSFLIPYRKKKEKKIYTYLLPPTKIFESNPTGSANLHSGRDGVASKASWSRLSLATSLGSPCNLKAERPLMEIPMKSFKGIFLGDIARRGVDFGNLQWNIKG